MYVYVTFGSVLATAGALPFFFGPSSETLAVEQVHAYVGSAAMASRHVADTAGWLSISLRAQDFTACKQMQQPS